MHSRFRGIALFRRCPFRILLCGPAILAGWALVATTPKSLASEAVASPGPSPEQLLKSLSKPDRFSVAVGNPDDPGTWGDECYDLHTWQLLHKREATDRNDIVAVTFHGAPTEEERYASGDLLPFFHITDAQVALLSKVKTLRRIVLADAGLTSQQLKMFASLTKLQVLSVHRCGVTNDGLHGSAR